MPKTIIYYECNICHQRHHTLEGAEECEAKGVAQEYPIGMIFGDTRKSSSYHDIVFAVAVNHAEGHYNDVSLWACRDTGVGDSLDKDLCGGNYRPGKEECHINRKLPAFKRMVDYLKSKDLPLMIWDGTKAVPLD